MKKPQKMTVKQLIAQLKKADPNAVVVMSSDSEGNAISPMSELFSAYCTPDQDRRGCVELLEAETDGAVLCVALWPMC